MIDLDLDRNTTGQKWSLQSTGKILPGDGSIEAAVTYAGIKLVELMKEAGVYKQLDGAWDEGDSKKEKPEDPGAPEDKKVEGPEDEEGPEEECVEEPEEESGEGPVSEGPVGEEPEEEGGEEKGDEEKD